MQPRNKFQRKILELSKKLSPLNEYQYKEAVRKVAPHIAKYNSKKEYVCLDCGHSWKGDEATKVVCPHCSAKLEVDKTRKWNFCDRAYFAIVTKRGGCQVVRMFFMQTNLRRGDKASYWMGEAFQKWLAPDGKLAIVGRARHWLSRYCDQWNWGSDMEIREENMGHRVTPYKVVGQSSIIQEIKRNGYKGDFHNCSPFTLFHRLLTCNKTETAWKVGQYKLVEYSFGSFYRFDKYWKSIKITIRHKYKIQDPTMWFDLLDALDYLGKDLLNPHFICPENLKDAHDKWFDKMQQQRQRARQKTLQQRYYAERAKTEANYKKSKSKFFGLEFVDQEIVVKPLTSVKEFLDEGNNLHHCVFTNEYYNKNNALILHALIDGVSVATIELSLENFTILQCRGVCNKIPPQRDRIIKLVNKNISQIISKTA